MEGKKERKKNLKKKLRVTVRGGKHTRGVCLIRNEGLRKKTCTVTRKEEQTGSMRKRRGARGVEFQKMGCKEGAEMTNFKQR